MQEGYVVESILERRINARGKTEYLVKWEGYPLSQATWEPIKHLQFVADMIKEFEQRAKKETIHQNSNQLTKTSKSKKQNEKVSSEISESSNIDRSRKRRGRPPKQSKSEPSLQGKSQKQLKQNRKQPIVIPDESEENVDAQEEGEQDEDSLLFSDVSDSLEVMEMRLVGNMRYFQIRFPHEVKWVSNQLMRKYYPRELIDFYEKYITVT